MPSVAICTPSRGLVHSRTVEAVLAALTVAKAQADAVTVCGWFFAHDLPIPDSHETVAARALDATDADYLWFVEEDVLPPPDALCALLATARMWAAGVVLLDYPVGEHPTHSTIMRQPDDGAILYGGLGCTLISRVALTERIPRPWFSTAHEIRQVRDTVGRWHLLETEGPYTYGGLDVAFCCKAAQHGVRLAAVDTLVAGHARLRALGAAHSNHGVHTIDILDRIEA